jgi:hypothetical protein
VRSSASEHKPLRRRKRRLLQECGDAGPELFRIHSPRFKRLRLLFGK